MNKKYGIFAPLLVILKKNVPDNHTSLGFKLGDFSCEEYQNNKIISRGTTENRQPKSKQLVLSEIKPSSPKSFNLGLEPLMRCYRRKNNKYQT